uniref:Dirigent protein n=1 Tax=Aegilops tauschii subsp. strangulata TaxID=200361 RepID=A0A453QHS4_AEGTS
ACTPTDGPTMEISCDGSSEPTMDVPMVHRSCPPRGSDVSTDFKVTCDFGGTVENAKVNVGNLYLRQIFAGCNTNQSDVIQPNAATGLGKTVVNNWGIYDGTCSEAKLVAQTHGMHTLAGKWSNWFTLVFVVGRFKGSTLQVMGANDDCEESEWAIVGGTGEFTMARGIINRRVHSVIGNTTTQELTIEFFCRMKEVIPAPIKQGPWGGMTGGSLHEMGGKSRRLESVTIYHHGVVEGLQFSYVDEDGQIHTTDTWGVNRGLFTNESLSFLL